MVKRFCDLCGVEIASGSEFYFVEFTCGSSYNQKDGYEVCPECQEHIVGMIETAID